MSDYQQEPNPAHQHLLASHVLGLESLNFDILGLIAILRRRWGGQLTVIPNKFVFWFSSSPESSPTLTHTESLSHLEHLLYKISFYEKERENELDNWMFFQML